MHDNTTDTQTNTTTEQTRQPATGVPPGFLTGLLDSLLDTNVKRKVAGAVALLFGILYILNPGGGIVELIPDFLPLVGNLDEAAATAIALWGLHYLTQGAISRDPNVEIIEHDEVRPGEVRQLPEGAERSNER